MLRRCSRKTRSPMRRLGLFARHFIVIGSRTRWNIDKLARGGSEKSSANICRASHLKTFVRSHFRPFETVRLRGYISHDAEGRTDRDGRNGDRGFARDYVSRRSRGPAQCSRPHFKQNARTKSGRGFAGGGRGGGRGISRQSRTSME